MYTCRHDDGEFEISSTHNKKRNYDNVFKNKIIGRNDDNCLTCNLNYT